MASDSPLEDRERSAMYEPVDQLDSAGELARKVRSLYTVTHGPGGDADGE